MILLFTDFGLEGPYTGQVRAVLAERAPGVPAIDLCADAPAFDPRASAYLLAASLRHCPASCTVLGVIDPGVGSDRAPLAVRVDDRWFVGPDNGLFEIAARRGTSVQGYRIVWRPEALSSSFHGRDLFAPVAAMLATGAGKAGKGKACIDPIADDRWRRPDWPDDLAEIVYLDRYGNAMTGMRARGIDRTARLRAKGVTASYARTFSEMPPGQPFWYENANGLVEISVNRDSAARLLKLSIGNAVEVLPVNDNSK